MSWLRRPRFTPVVLGFGLALASPAFTGVLPVSPGAADRLLEVTSACPTFAWSGTEGAVAYELAVLDLGDGDNPVLVYSRRIEGAALAWVPSREECLTPGRVYAWLVRADLAGSGLGEWSAPRRFRVPGAPSIEEVDAALALLERWRTAQSGGSSSAGGSRVTSAPGKSTSASGDPATAEVEVPLATGVAAIRGEIPDTAGSAYGLFGITHSAAGAGIVARNEAVGPDLVLDGAAQGEPDTLLHQSGLDRPSASSATFNFQNSGAGALTLQVDGVAVDTATTPIAWSRLASIPAGLADGVDNDTTYAAGNQLQLVGTQFNVLEGSGSGLDSDTLDGLHGVALQARVIGVCAVGQTMQGVNADGSVVCYETPVPPRVSVVDDPANSVISYTSIAIGSDGFPVISYYDNTADTLKVAKCNDAACAGGDETFTTVDDPANLVGEYASIAIGIDGFPVISYRDNTAGALKVAKCNDAACAGGNETITTVDEPANSVGTYTSIAIGIDGFPVISYRDGTAGALKVAKCNDAACAGANETITTVDDPANNVGWYTSIAIGSDGFPVISHLDLTAHALKVAKCNDAACAGGNETITTVDDPADSVGYYTSIAIGSDGFPVISYFNDTARSLKVAKCNNASCTLTTITTVDDPANGAGSYTSIAIGSDGFPVISYLDTFAVALKVAKCNDAACAGGNETITTVDHPANSVGYYTSIAIGIDGFPVISYLDSTADTLKVAKCMNASCRY
jgi:hypothetical protein